MKIKILEKTKGCFPQVFEQGDWYDLCLAEDVTLKAPYAHKLRHWKNENNNKDIVRDVTFDSCVASLGICVEVPEGYESIVEPRSSTFNRFGIMLPNSVGVIDNTYKSDTDVWHFPMVATRAVTIPKGTRIAQFRVQLSQKATLWQKIKWLFSSAPVLVKVNSLSNKARGGFGSTN